MIVFPWHNVQPPADNLLTFPILRTNSHCCGAPMVVWPRERPPPTPALPPAAAATALGRAAKNPGPAVVCQDATAMTDAMGDVCSSAVRPGGILVQPPPPSPSSAVVQLCDNSCRQCAGDKLQQLADRRNDLDSYSPLCDCNHIDPQSVSLPQALMCSVRARRRGSSCASGAPVPRWPSR